MLVFGFLDGVDELVVDGEHRDLSLLLAGGLGELLELGADQLDGIVGDLESGDHVLFGHFVRTRLHHRNRALVAGDHEVEVGFVDLVDRGEQDELAIDSADANTSDRTLERDVGEHERGASGADAEHVGRTVLVDSEGHGDDLDVVAKALREQRSQGSVDEPAGEYRLLGRASAALDEAAGDLADRVLALFVVAGQGKKIDALARVLGHGGDAEHDGFAHSEENGAAGLFGDAARFDAEGFAPNFEGVGLYHMGKPPSLSGRVRPAPRRRPLYAISREKLRTTADSRFR